MMFNADCSLLARFHFQCGQGLLKSHVSILDLGYVGQDLGTKPLVNLNKYVTLSNKSEIQCSQYPLPPVYLDCFMSEIDNHQPLSKRKWVDDVHNQPAVLVNPVRLEIWYEDGNVILRAGGTQLEIYRCALADNLTAFKVMFSFPQQPDGRGMFRCT